MRRVVNCVLSLLIICSVCIGIVPTAFAAGGEVIFSGMTERFSFAPGSGYSSTDLFAGFKDVMPGNILTETITIKNKSRQSDSVKLYLRVVPHDSGNPATYSESYEYTDGKDQTGIVGQQDETIDSMADFLSKLMLRVYHGDSLFYEDALYGFSDMTDAVYLGTLDRYHTLNLKLELEVPAELDNRYANRVGETDWTFTAEVFDNPQKPDIPKTGDMILAVVVIMGISCLLFALILFTRRHGK